MITGIGVLVTHTVVCLDAQKRILGRLGRPTSMIFIWFFPLWSFHRVEDCAPLVLTYTIDFLLIRTTSHVAFSNGPWAWWAGSKFSQAAKALLCHLLSKHSSSSTIPHAVNTEHVDIQIKHDCSKLSPVAVYKPIKRYQDSTLWIWFQLQGGAWRHDEHHWSWLVIVIAHFHSSAFIQVCLCT